MPLDSPTLHGNWTTYPVTAHCSKDQWLAIFAVVIKLNTKDRLSMVFLVIKENTTSLKLIRTVHIRTYIARLTSTRTQKFSMWNLTRYNNTSSRNT